MTKQYVEMRDGGYWVTGTRISLDSIVYGFLNGRSPESIQDSFPLLTLEEIYGAITFYLGRQAEIDLYLQTCRSDFETARQAARTAHPLLYKKLEEAKKQTVGL